jgi:hypothetical protein
MQLKPHVRGAMAAAAIAATTQKSISAIYSYSEGGYLKISIAVKGTKTNGYDYSNSCHVSGILPSLYHYGESSHISLKEKSSGKFAGYDYGSSSHFDITVTRRSASLYDYGDGKWHNYTA